MADIYRRWKMHTLMKTRYHVIHLEKIWGILFCAELAEIFFLIFQEKDNRKRANTCRDVKNVLWGIRSLTRRNLQYNWNWYFMVETVCNSICKFFKRQWNTNFASIKVKFNLKLLQQTTYETFEWSYKFLTIENKYRVTNYELDVQLSLPCRLEEQNVFQSNFQLS